MKDRELGDREVEIKRQIEVLFFKPIIVSIDDKDKFEEKEMKKIKPIKSIWFDWLNNFIPEPIRKIVVLIIKLLVFLRKKQLNKKCGGGGRKENKQLKNTKTI